MKTTLIFLLVSVLFFAVGHPVDAQSGTCTVESPVVASNDDGYLIYSGYTIDQSSNLVYASDPGISRAFFLRFPLDVPQGVSITAAYITAMANSDTGDGGKFYIQQEDDAPQIDPSNAFASRSYSGSVSWNPAEWTTGQEYDSPSLVSLVQQSINRAGWQSGNHVQFFGYPVNTGEFSFYSFDSGYPSTLHVEYACDPTPTPTPTPTSTIAPTDTPGPTPTPTWVPAPIGTPSQDELSAMTLATLEMPYTFTPVDVSAAPSGENMAADPVSSIGLGNLITDVSFLNRIGSIAATIWAILDNFAGGGVLGYFVVILLAVVIIRWIAGFVYNKPINEPLNVSASGDVIGEADPETGQKVKSAVRLVKNRPRF